MNLENLSTVQKSGYLYGLLVRSYHSHLELAYSMDSQLKQWYVISNRNGNLKFKSYKEVFKAVHYLYYNSPCTHSFTVFYSIIPIGVEHEKTQNVSETEPQNLFSWQQDQLSQRSS